MNNILFHSLIVIIFVYATICSIKASTTILVENQYNTTVGIVIGNGTIISTNSSYVCIYYNMSLATLTYNIPGIVHISIQEYGLNETVIAQPTNVTLNGTNYYCANLTGPDVYYPSLLSSNWNTCIPGSFWYDNTICLECGYGTYSSFSNQTLCTDCQPGRFSNGYGASICSPCTSGTYTNNTAQSSCQLCNAGTFMGNMGATSCIGCSPGSFSRNSQSTTCLTCEPNTFQPNSSQTICQDCQVGYISPANSTFCTELLCTPGHYVNETGRECIPCSIGTFSNATTQTICFNCNPGTYSKTIGASSCSPCLPGSFSNNFQSTSCTLCVVNTFQPNSSQTTCLPCPSGYSSLSNSTSCTKIICSYDYYLNITTNECVLCPSIHELQFNYTSTNCTEWNYDYHNNDNAISSIGLYVASGILSLFLLCILGCCCFYCFCHPIHRRTQYVEMPTIR